MDCKPIETRPGWGTCPMCDPSGAHPMPMRARRTCGPWPVAAPLPVVLPPLWRRAVRYVWAVIGWFVGGRGVRPGWHVDLIYYTRCVPCERFIADRGSCSACGCCVSTSRSALRNKIAMRTESCPLERW